MKTFKMFLESSFAAREGEHPDVFHHISGPDVNAPRQQIKNFRPMSHFGEPGTVRNMKRVVDDRAGDEYNPRIRHYAVRLKTGTIHDLPDDHDQGNEEHSPYSIAKALQSQGVLTHEETNNRNNTRSHAAIARLIRSKGINTLRYKNNLEGGTSYIITHPNQVRILKQTRPGREATVNTSRAYEPTSYSLSDRDPFY